MTSRGQTRLAYALLLMTGGLWLTGAAQAKTINVAAGHSIQAAIDLAVKGDVVIVAEGTYKERLDFKGKAITVQSTAPTNKTVVAATIIDGDKLGSVVVFKSSEKAASALKGFTLTNGTGDSVPGAAALTFGGGVYCYNASAPTLAYNLISKNTSSCGAGVYCNNSSPILTHNTISDNKTPGGYPALGGGVFCDQGSSPALTYNTISRNFATGGGGVSCDHNSSPTLTHNTISANVADYGGGVSSGGGSNPTISGNTISGNSSAGGGGGVYCNNCSPILTGNAISANEAAGFPGAGGGVSCYYSSPTLTSNVISGNTAKSGGGGVYCNSSSPNLTNNTIAGNSAANGPLATYGGGVDCYASSSPILTNNTLSGNSATHGGGVYCEYLSSPILKNTIVAFSSMGGGLDVFVDAAHPCYPAVTYCDFYSNTGGEYLNWPSQTGQKGNLSKNPLFANVAKRDYHEKSKGGRWNVATKTWVVDTVQSPCIDGGDKTSPFALELAPNGGRINMGAYGNTAQASKSAPVAPLGGLQVSAAAAPVSGGGVQLSVNLSSAASVEVTIINLAGRAVAGLPASDLPEGVSTLLWSGKSATGLRVPAGTYLARLTARTEDGDQCQALATVTVRR